MPKRVAAIGVSHWHSAFVVALGRHCDLPETFRSLVDAGTPFPMEKPWGTDLDTVADLARLAAEKGAWVTVPFMLRYSVWAIAPLKVRALVGAYPGSARVRHGTASLRRIRSS
jgi:hypothetical protein